VVDESLDELREKIQNLETKIATQKSNLFQLGIVVMLLATVIYVMILQLYVAMFPTTESLLQLFIGLALVIAPLFILAGFFIVNEFRR
jgi:hypothetical protein